MFWAIHKKTGRKVNSLIIFKDASFQTPYDEKWIADPDEIENWDEIKVKHPEIKVVYVKEKQFINYNGTDVGVSPHFRIPNSTKLGINIIPETKEHRLAKNWIYNRLNNNDLNLWYSSVNKPFKYINSFKLEDINIDYQKISIETQVVDVKKRIADVICPFVSTNPLLGNGIVFEIQFGKIRTEETRSEDWAFKGYSVCWLHQADFQTLNEDLIELKDKNVKVNSFAVLLKNGTKNQIRNLKYEVQNQSRLLDQKLIDYQKNAEEMLLEYLTDLQEQFKKPSIEMEFFKMKEVIKKLANHLSTPECPFHKVKLVERKNKEKGNKFWGCPLYPQCKYTLKFDEDLAQASLGIYNDKD